MSSRLPRHALRSLAAATLLVAGAAPAQTQLTLLPGQGLPTRTSAFGAALADLDGDGDVDALTCRLFDLIDVWVNDGRGSFAVGPRFPPLGVRIECVFTTDADGDGDADALVIEKDVALRLFLNDGTGRFREDSARLPSTRLGRFWTARGLDVDDDGDTDLVLGGKPPDSHRLFLGDGNGRFTDVTATQLPATVTQGMHVVAADIDADGDPDLYFGGSDRDLLLLNDGTGRFEDVTATHLPGAPASFGGVALADVTGDGAPELLRGVRIGLGGRLDLLVNEGGGRFREAAPGQVPAVEFRPDGIAAGDIDEDGDVDVVAGSLSRDSFGEPLQLFVNTGGGWFASAPGRADSVDTETTALALVDLDGDRDLDLFEGAHFNALARGGSQVFFNRHRHLQTDAVATRGGTFTIRVVSQPGYGALFAVALPMVALVEGRLTREPFGTLRLDAHEMIVLPPAYVAPGAEVSVGVPLPDDPNLAGRTLFTQALILRPTATARLTNQTAAPIR